MQQVLRLSVHGPIFSFDTCDLFAAGSRCSIKMQPSLCTRLFLFRLWTLILGYTADSTTSNKVMVMCSKIFWPSVYCLIWRNPEGPSEGTILFVDRFAMWTFSECWGPQHVSHLRVMRDICLLAGVHTCADHFGGRHGWRCAALCWAFSSYCVSATFCSTGDGLKCMRDFIRQGEALPSEVLWRKKREEELNLKQSWALRFGKESMNLCWTWMVFNMCNQVRPLNVWKYFRGTNQHNIAPDQFAMKTSSCVMFSLRLFDLGWARRVYTGFFPMLFERGRNPLPLVLTLNRTAFFSQNLWPNKTAVDILGRQACRRDGHKHSNEITLLWCPDGATLCWNNREISSIRKCVKPRLLQRYYFLHANSQAFHPTFSVIPGFPGLSVFHTATRNSTFSPERTRLQKPSHFRRSVGQGQSAVVPFMSFLSDCVTLQFWFLGRAAEHRAANLYPSHNVVVS